MGLLSTKFKSEKQAMTLSSPGCFTVDREGNIISSTLPQTFSPEMAQKIGQTVLAAFQGAQHAQLIFNEIQVSFSALKLTARELRGGAIIFLTPFQPVPNSSPELTSSL